VGNFCEAKPQRRDLQTAVELGVRKHMKGIYSVFALLVFVLSMHAASEENRAAELVGVMRLDFSALDSTIWSIRRKVQLGEMKADVSECLSKIDHKRFTKVWAEQVASKLTEEEIEIALDFYSSPAGRKYTEYGLTDAHNKFAGSNIEKYPTFLKSEQKNILEFANSITGLKLIKDHVLTSPYPDRVAALQNQLVLDCVK
jgi:hypothetical protein